MSADLSSLVSDLQRALGIRVPCGQIVLNMNDGQVQSVETHTKQRVVPLDDRARLRETTVRAALLDKTAALGG